MTATVTATASLAGKIRNGSDFIVAPGVFDMLSAKIADRLGFHAIYMTGSGTVASFLGLPDAGIATYTDMVSRAGRIASGAPANREAAYRPDDPQAVRSDGREQPAVGGQR